MLYGNLLFQMDPLIISPAALVAYGSPALPENNILVGKLFRTIVLGTPHRLLWDFYPHRLLNPIRGRRYVC